MPEYEAEDALPPSARWYGTPAPPPRRRLPRWLSRTLLASLAVAVAAGVISAAVTVVLRTTSPEPDTRTVHDTLAGVRYPLPAGWSEGAMAPVTAFTSVASDGGGAMLMTRATPADRGRPIRETAVELTELYSRLLLHGDKVDVVDDREITVGGRPAHSRALRAEYKDVVNRPAYLRVVVIDRGGSTVVVAALSQPDDPAARADIDAMITGMAV
ncbi:hypothetical protein HNP84_007913 [Thermocatellispora tengchongensis]|uniref:Uncharacterized protein n=1 Tax=Thermocatellispora tengchongensis TaxID=1073253 RepID=A0A840PKM7_9ACTN|nr:hypothetical protein [Thermocatellispora tengchongensis]MBB5138160.1 hypothetical protein [Thermocatellispora tengchongensis]